MKRALVFLLLGLGLAVPGVAQVNTSEVEIWGLPAGTTPLDFVNQLNRNQQTVCMAAIRPMGYPDANVIYLNDILLVTLRGQPAPACQQRAAPDAAVAAQLNAAWRLRDLHTPELQVAMRAWPAVQAQDTAAVRGFRQKAQLSPARYQAALGRLARPGGPSFEQAVAVLCTTAPDSVREKAFVQATARLRTGPQLRQLLPYLRDSDLGGRVLLQVRGFTRYHPLAAAEWAGVLPEVVQALQSPDPVVVAGLASWLTEQRVPRQYAARLAGEAGITQREILRGQHPNVGVFKEQLYPFLSYLAAQDIRTEAAALAYLEGLAKRKG